MEKRMPQRILKMSFLPSNSDLGLLALRAVAFSSLFIKHGYEKFANFSFLATHIPDPLHIGQACSFAFAMISDSFCSILLLIGLVTRWAALFVLITLIVAWTLVDRFAYFGHGWIPEHGEGTVVYIATLVAVLIAGAGRYSVDALWRD